MPIMIRRVWLSAWLALMAAAHAAAGLSPVQTSSFSPAAAPKRATSSLGPKARAEASLRSEAWKLLLQGARSERSRDRSDTLSALTILEGDPRAIVLYEKALEDKDADIRVLAATSLGAMKARTAIPALQAALEDKSPHVSFAAARALWKMDDHSGRDIFYQVLKGKRKTGPGMIQGKVTEAERELESPKQLALLGINQASGAFLGPFSMGVSFIEEYAMNNSASVQALCANLLASDNSQRTYQELKDALGDGNWAVRAAAARSLAKLGRTAAIPRLAEMMRQDKSQPARYVAAAALLRLTNTPEKPLIGPASPGNSSSSAGAKSK